MLSVDIWHNLLWSRYKGIIFSRLYEATKDSDVSIRFFQIAVTDGQRNTLTSIDTSYHTYPYELVFDGSYDAIPKFRLCVKLVQRVWTSPADLILIAGYGNLEYWLQLATALLRGKRVGTFCDSTAYDHPQKKLKSYLKRLFFSRCQVVFCYGDRSAAYVASFGIPADSIVPHAMAAALPHDYSAEKALTARMNQATVREMPVFLYVGRLSPEKRLDVLLKAFATLRPSLPAAVLRIVGSGPERTNLEALAETLGLGDAITFTGPKFGDDLFSEYSLASALILPSESEPWGLVVNEALAYGCPVIVSDHCGCVPELVLDGQTGYTFQSGNTEELATRMKLLIENFDQTEATASRLQACVGQYTPERAAEKFTGYFARLKSALASKGRNRLGG